MSIRLDDSHSEYIKMTISGVIDKTTLIQAISELMGHSEYLDKHSYWDFTKGKMGVSMGELKEIIELLLLYKPQRKEFANKSALVVDSKMNQAMGDFFLTFTRLLPFEYQFFDSHQEAERFLLKE